MGLDVAREYDEEPLAARGRPQQGVRPRSQQARGKALSSHVCRAAKPCLRLSCRAAQPTQFAFPILIAIILRRLCLLLHFHALRGGTWIVEQPATTLMWLSEKFQTLLGNSQASHSPVTNESCEFPPVTSASYEFLLFCRRRSPQRSQAFIKRFPMGSFGCPSMKPTHLLSNSPMILELRPGQCKPSRSTITRRYVDAQGRRRCTGTKSLRSTQPGAQLPTAAFLAHLLPKGCTPETSVSRRHVLRRLQPGLTRGPSAKRLPPWLGGIAGQSLSSATRWRTPNSLQR